MTARCEPPEALRGVDGYHVVWMSGRIPVLKQWNTPSQTWNGQTPDQAAGIGYRYGGPAPQPGAPAPADVAALVEAGKPYVEAYRNAVASGRPWFEFVGIRELETLRAALSRVEGETE